MKRTAVWILLALYLNASASMVMPWVQDCVAHIFFWEHHLEHAHAGHTHSHHVYHEIAALAANENQEQSNAPENFFGDSGKNPLSGHLLTLLLAKPQHPAEKPFWHPSLLADGSFLYRSIIGEIIVQPPDLG